MGTNSLKSPAANFSALPLKIEQISPSAFFRISTHLTGEPFFGRGAAHRFDDPSKNPKKRFGTCYLGLSLAVAFAESVLHDAEPENGGFAVPSADIDRRFVHGFTGDKLKLANLTGTALRKLGGNAELTGSANYTISQKWSVALCSHPAKVDGFLYMSRHVNDSVAAVLFQRDPKAKNLMKMAKPVALQSHVDFLDTMEKFQVRCV
jgi:hypothetical protein